MAIPSPAQWARETDKNTQQNWLYKLSMAEQAVSEQDDEPQRQALRDVQAQALKAYNAATGQNLATADFHKAMAPEGFTSNPLGLGDQLIEREQGLNAAQRQASTQYTDPKTGKTYIQSFMQPTEADFANGNAVRAPDGTVYMEYNRANELGNAASNQGGGMFFGAGPSMVDLPVTLAGAVVGAGITGGLGALQGLQGTSLIPGFDLANLGGNPASLNGGSGTESILGQAAGDTLGGAAGSPLLPGSELIGGGNLLTGGGATGVGGMDLIGGSALTDATLAGVASGGSLAPFLGTAAGPLTIPGQVVDLANSGGSMVPGTGGGGAGGITTPPGASTALQRILNGEGTAADWTQMLGGVGSSVLGVLGSNAQADAYQNVANQNLAIGAPYRDRLNASYQPGFNLWDDPTYKAGLDSSMDSMMRSLSTQGNPFGNPGGLIEAQKSIQSSLGIPALSNYRGQLGQFGGLGLNTSGQAQMAGASQEGGMYDALGFGLSQLTGSGQNNWQDLLKQLGGGQNQYKLNLGGLLT